MSIALLYSPQLPSRFDRINTSLLSGVHPAGDEMSSVNVSRRGSVIGIFTASRSETYTERRSTERLNTSFLPSAVWLMLFTQKPDQSVILSGDDARKFSRSIRDCHKLQLIP